MNVFNSCTNACPISLENKSILPDFLNSELPERLNSIRFYNDRIVITNRVRKSRCKSDLHENSLLNLKENKVKGKLSAKSLRHLKSKLLAWFDSIREHNEKRVNKYEKKEHYIIMVTLTLCAEQFHDDKYLKRELFGRFIENVTSKYNIKHYFIRYEAQSNGNIHGHLILDKWIDNKEIQNVWNKHLKRLGYLKLFENKYKHSNPPSVKITGGHNTKNLIDYVIKYATKEESNRIIIGRLYGMSDTLRKLDVYECFLDNSTFDFLNEVVVRHKPLQFSDDFYSVLFINREVYSRHLPVSMKMDITVYNLRIYDYLYNNGLHPYEIERNLNSRCISNYLYDNDLEKGNITINRKQNPIVKQLELFPAGNVFKRDFKRF